MSATASLLRALEVFRELSPNITLRQIVAFLHVAEHESIMVRDVARAAGFSQSAASRSLRTSGIAGSDWAAPPALGLIEAFLGENDERCHALHLTEAGLRLCDALEAAMASPVSAPHQAIRARRGAH
jgi:DNA-binding MarR family transcriptional regulator